MKNIAPFALAALLPLAACGGGHKPVADTAGPPPLTCPQVAVLQQAQTVTLFLPGRADAAARISTAQITGVSGTCLLKSKKRTVLVTVHTGFLADNGPANQFAPLALPWFAAITEGDHIIQKTDYTQILRFDGNESTASASAKAVKIELPDGAGAGDVQILIGFEESPDQLAYAAAHAEAAP